MKRTGTLLLALFLGVCFGSHCEATVYYSDGSAANVQILHDILAQDGDIITVPTGTFTWLIPVTISKGIEIQGAGGGRVEGTSTSRLAIGTGSKSFTVRSGSTINGFTVGETVKARQKYISTNWMKGTVTSWDGTTLILNVTNTSGSGTISVWVFEVDAPTVIINNAGIFPLFGITESTAQSIDISGIRFVKGIGTGQAIYVTPRTNGKPVLVHDCRFSATSPTTDVRYAVNRGVVYKCYFDRGFNWYDGGTNHLDNSNGVHCELSEGGNSWTSPNTMGDADTTGTNNLYIEDCFFTGFHLGAIDFSTSIRGVFRHNVLDNSGITTHGPDTSPEGMRHGEFYNCTGIFDGTFAQEDWVANMNYWITWRGGSGIVTDNTFDDIVSWAWGDKGGLNLECQMINRNSGPYACWNGGYPVPHQTGQGYPVLEGCYIWNNVTLQFGPAQYRPDECGRGYVVTDYIQLGRDYFASAKSGYTKYTYPHPLRSEPTPTPTPNPTPTPTPTETPTPTPTPAPTATPPPNQCEVPNFIGTRMNHVQSVWNDAGFTTEVIIFDPFGWLVTWQSLPEGFIGSCSDTTITVQSIREDTPTARSSQLHRH